MDTLRLDKADEYVDDLKSKAFKFEDVITETSCSVGENWQPFEDENSNLSVEEPPNPTPSKYSHVEASPVTPPSKRTKVAGQRSHHGLKDKAKKVITFEKEKAASESTQKIQIRCGNESIPLNACEYPDICELYLCVLCKGVCSQPRIAPYGHLYCEV